MLKHQNKIHFFLLGLLVLILPGLSMAQVPKATAVGQPASSAACHVLVLYDNTQAYSSGIATGSQGVDDFLTSAGSFTNGAFFQSTYAGYGFNFTVDAVAVPGSYNSGKTWTSGSSVSSLAPMAITPQNYCMVFDLRFSQCNYNDYSGTPQGSPCQAPIPGNETAAEDTITSADDTVYAAYVSQGGGLFILGDNFYDPSAHAGAGYEEGFITRMETMYKMVNTVASTGVTQNAFQVVGGANSNDNVGAVGNPYGINTNVSNLVGMGYSLGAVYPGPVIGVGSAQVFAQEQDFSEPMGLAWQGAALKAGYAGSMIYWADSNVMNIFALNSGNGNFAYFLSNMATFLDHGTCCGATPTPTNTATNTPTKTPTNTFTPSPTFTNTPTKTFTSTFTNTFTSTPTPTNTDTRTFTATFTNTFTSTYTNTFTKTFTATFTNTFTNTLMNTATYTNTFTNTPTNTFTKTFTATFTNTFTNTLMNTATLTNTFTNTPTATYSNTFTKTFTATFTPTYTNTFTSTFTNTATNTLVNTGTNTNTFTNTPTFTFSSTPTKTPTATFTATFTNTFVNTPTFTDTFTNTFTPTATDTLMNTATFTDTFTSTATPTFSNTTTDTFTFTPTPTDTNTFVNTPTHTNTFTDTATNTWTATNTSTYTLTPTSTATRTQTNTFTFTATPTRTFTDSPTLTFTNTATSTPSFTSTPTTSIGLSKKVSESQAHAGDSLTYSIAVTVSGNSASGLVVTDTLPAGVTFSGFSTSNPVAGSFNASTDVLSWTMPSPLAPGVYTLTYQTAVNGFVAADTVLLNKAQLTEAGSLLPINVSAPVTVIGTFTVKVNVYNSAGEVVKSILIKAFSAPVNNISLESSNTITSLKGPGSTIELFYNGFLIGTWDGTNNSGSPVSNGSYVIQVDNVSGSGIVTSVSQKAIVSRSLSNISANVYNSAGEVVRVLYSVVDNPMGATMSNVKLSSDVLRPSLTASAPTGSERSNQATIVIETSGTPVTLIWDGTTNGGSLVTPGVYSIEVHWNNGSGETADISREIVVLSDSGVSAAAIARPNVLNKINGMSTTFDARSVPNAYSIKVQIYTVTGELVKTLTSGGAVETAWDASGVASGIYVASVEIDDANSGVINRQRLKVLVMH